MRSGLEVREALEVAGIGRSTRKLVACLSLTFLAACAIIDTYPPQTDAGAPDVGGDGSSHAGAAGTTSSSGSMGGVAGAGGAATSAGVGGASTSAGAGGGAGAAGTAGEGGMGGSTGAGGGLDASAGAAGKGGSGAGGQDAASENPGTKDAAPRDADAALADADAGNPRPLLPVVDGRILHVEADFGVMFVSGNKVATWSDQSGLGHDGTSLMQNPATKSAEMLGGLPAIDFSGAGGPLSSPQGLTFGNGFVNFRSGFSSFSLVRIKDPGAPLDDLALNLPELRADVDSTIAIRANVNEHAPSLTYTSGGQSLAATSPAVSRWALIEVIHDAQTGSAAIYVDGAMVGQGTVGTAPGVSRILNLSGGITQGSAALVLVYDRGLSNTERVDVERYITNKWQYK